MQRGEQPGAATERWNGVLFPIRYQKWGGSYAMIIPAPVRELLHLRPGDTLLLRVHVPFFTVRRGEPEDVIPLKSFRLEDYPPQWPRAGKSARVQSDPERAAPGAAEPDAGKDGPGRDG